MLLVTTSCSLAAERFQLRDQDVVAFIGGGDVAAAQHTGHLESLLVASFPMVRFRNFGWEGDTVFAQPRDFNFPPLLDHLRKAGVTVAVVQFGRAEALTDAPADFTSAYKKLIGEINAAVKTLILVTPVPFEKAGAPLPDLTKRNTQLKAMADTIQEIGKEKNLLVVDLYSALEKKSKRITDDGLQLTAFGHAIVARAFVQELGLASEVRPAARGEWQSTKLEAVRQAVIAKNKLWFHYWRPQNWAFLGGDRIEQPSSRDHRDSKVRWFPSEIEKFAELIAAEEREITKLGEQVNEK